MPRIEAAGIAADEKDAIQSIVQLLESLEECCFQCDAQGIDSATITQLHRAYRALKKTALFYYEPGDLPLVWDPPDGKFKPKGARI